MWYAVKVDGVYVDCGNKEFDPEDFVGSEITVERFSAPQENIIQGLKTTVNTRRQSLRDKLQALDATITDEMLDELIPLID